MLSHHLYDNATSKTSTGALHVGGTMLEEVSAPLQVVTKLENLKYWRPGTLEKHWEEMTLAQREDPVFTKWEVGSPDGRREP